MRGSCQRGIIHVTEVEIEPPGPDGIPFTLWSGVEAFPFLISRAKATNTMHIVQRLLEEDERQHQVCQLRPRLEGGH